jgi:hypothetical protein
MPESKSLEDYLRYYRRLSRYAKLIGRYQDWLDGTWTPGTIWTV